MNKPNRSLAVALTQIAKAPGVALAAPLLSQGGRLLEITRDVPGLGALVATLTVAAVLGLNSFGWIRDDRAKRAAKALLGDPDLTIDDYRARWAPKVDREAVSRQLREQLVAIDNAAHDEVADVLLNVLRYRTKFPQDADFGVSALAFFRDARLQEIALLKTMLTGALLATDEQQLSLFNNRMLSEHKDRPGILIAVADDGGKYVCPADAVTARRTFRRLKDADFARSTGMTVGNFVYDAKSSSRPQDSAEDSLIIDRISAQKLVQLVQQL